MNAIARLTGFRFFERTSRGFELRFRWAEITGGFGLGLGLLNWSEDGDWSLHIRLGWPNIYLKLPFLPRRQPKEQMLDQWGFSWHETDLHLHWGERTKIVHMPWAPTWVRTSVLQTNGSWEHETKAKRNLGNISASDWRAERDRMQANRWQEAYPYIYTLRSGEVQNRTATVGVEEREWRWRWLTWQSLFTNVQRSIDVQFDGEIGERSGSWKGGTIGCGYTLRPGETPLQCLRRMEAERKF